jgi:hypothetical protein
MGLAVVVGTLRLAVGVVGDAAHFRLRALAKYSGTLEHGTEKSVPRQAGRAYASRVRMPTPSNSYKPAAGCARRSLFEPTDQKPVQARDFVVRARHVVDALLLGRQRRHQVGAGGRRVSGNRGHAGGVGRRRRSDAARAAPESGRYGGRMFAGKAGGWW